MGQATVGSLPQADLLDNAGDFMVSLRAANKSPATLETYRAAIERLDTFLADRGMPRTVAAIRREHLEAFLADLLDRGQRPGTAANRYRSLQQFFRWLVIEGEIKVSPMANMNPPAIPDAPPPVLRDEQLSRLLDTCRTGTSFEDRRDFAILQLLIRTGIRRAEVAALRWDPANPELQDYDRDQGLIHVVGKGARPRVVVVDRELAEAMRKYLKARKLYLEGNRRREPGMLWLGHKGALGSTGIFQMIRRRGREAGLGDLYPHLFRHAMAHERLTNGMQESDLMKLMGWKSPTMVRRYAASAATERAIAAQRRLERGKL